MKNESVAALLESGEIQRTEDVVFMLDTIAAMFNRGLESDTGNFIGLAIELMNTWRESLDASSTALADEAIANIVFGSKE